jgi:hypothetical protein
MSSPVECSSSDRSDRPINQQSSTNLSGRRAFAVATSPMLGGSEDGENRGALGNAAIVTRRRHRARVAALYNVARQPPFNHREQLIRVDGFQ